MLIPKEYKDELDELRSQLMEKIAEGPGELADYIKFVLIKNDFTPEECDKMASVIKRNPAIKEFRKKAADIKAVEKGISLVGKSLKNNPIVGGLAAATGLIALSSASSALQKGVANVRANMTYKQVLNKNPELRKDPNIDSYFKTIKYFTPTVAGDENVLANALQHAHEFGRLEYPLLKDLIQIQTGVIGPPQKPSASAKVVGDVAKAMAGLAPVTTETVI